jgi:hypothetical protein
MVSENATAETDSFLIPAPNYEALEATIAKLARRQQKLSTKGPLADTTPIGIVRLGTTILPALCRHCRREKAQHYQNGATLSCWDRTTYWFAGPERVYYQIRVTGARAYLNGYEFIATRQHEEAGVILRTVPTAQVARGELDRFRNVEPHCEHCEFVRRRKDTFLVRSDDGTIKQVGRNCLSAYLGGADPQALAKLAELLIEARSVASSADEYDWCGGGHGELTASIAQFLTYVATSIRLDGWVSRGQARDHGDATATADIAWRVLFPFGPRDREEAQRFQGLVEKRDYQLAQDALARCRTELTEQTTKSDYEHNLRVVCASDIVKASTVGLAASVVSWYERLLGRELARQQTTKTTKDSKHVGVVGEMINVTVGVLGVHDGDSQWGVYYFHRLLDDAGNVFVWRSTKERLDVGSRYKLRAKIKEHGEYKGTLQTVLTRARVKEAT